MYIGNFKCCFSLEVIVCCLHENVFYAYYIISAGLGEDIIERPLGDLDGFVEHLEEYKIAGKIYAANVMDAGLVRNQSVFKKAYDMGYSVQNAEKLRVGE